MLEVTLSLNLKKDMCMNDFKTNLEAQKDF